MLIWLLNFVGLFFISFYLSRVCCVSEKNQSMRGVVSDHCQRHGIGRRLHKTSKICFKLFCVKGTSEKLFIKFITRASTPFAG